MKSRHLIVILMFLSVTTNAAEKCGLREFLSTFFGKSFNNLVVHSNGFEIGRNLAEYYRVFGDDLVTALNKIRKEGGHWIDAGAGRAQAQIDFIKTLSPRNQTQITAIGVRKPFFTRTEAYSVIDQYHLNEHVEFKYFSGKKLESIPVNAIAKADLVTDLYGVFTYSHHIDRALQQELNALKVGGDLLINYPGGESILIKDANGVAIPFEKWINSFEGVEVHALMGDPYFSRGLRLVRTSKNIRVPELYLDWIDSNIPPDRTYIWKNR